MTRVLALFGCLALAAACTDLSIDSGQTPIGSARSVSYVQEYGFCLARCFRALEISSQGAATLTVRDHRGGASVYTRSFTLPAADRDRLFDAAREAADNPWEDRYGCPDCVDQGSYNLTVEGTAAARSTVLDPQDHPAHFDALLDELDDILHDHLE